MKWIDNSKAGTLERCPRQFWYRYIANLTSQEENIKIAFGKAIHKGFEAVFDQLALGDNDLDSLFDQAVIASTLYWQSQLDSNQELFFNSQSSYLSEEAIVSVFSTWFSEVWTQQLALQLGCVVGSEVVVKIPLGWNDWWYVCRADLVIRDSIGQLVLIDHKTTGQPPTMIAKSNELGTQLPSYAMAVGEFFGETCSLAFLNIVQYSRRWLQSGRWSKETCRAMLHPVAISLQRLEMMRFRYVAAVAEFERRVEENIWEVRPSACSPYNRACEYWTLCDRFWKEKPCERHKEIALELGFKELEWNPFNLEV